jgi:glycosyltransferase involved in cell wall biosynthesis
MRIVFYNPHTNIWFKKPLYFFLTKRKSVNKYEYLLDYIIENKIEFSFLVDGRDFSFGKKYFNSILLAKLEIYIWVILNKINPFKIKVLSKISKLQSDDILLIFLYGSLMSTGRSEEGEKVVKELIKELKSSKALKVGHLTHFMYDAKLAGINTQEAEIDIFIAENNLKKNSPFFNKYFAWYDKDVSVLPFVAQKRFKNNTPFSKRVNMAVATGTLPFPIKNIEFIDFFKTSDIHPMRRQIYENRNSLKSLIKSYIFEMGENKKSKNFKINLINKVFNYLFSHFQNKQTSYFAFDIVELYNSHTMFVVPEEINGLPGIGFIEGLMCGCVLIGKSDAYYEDLGFIDGVNFISYDGTLNDLVNKITFYQNNSNLLEGISIKSYEFVKSNFNENIVSSIFIDNMKALVSPKIY